MASLHALANHMVRVARQLREPLRSGPGAALAIGFVVFLLTIAAWRARVFGSLELRVYDRLVAAIAADGAPDPRIVLIEVTEADIRALDHWPLSDTEVALPLVRTCKEHQVDPFQDVIDLVSTHPMSRINKLTPAR